MKFNILTLFPDFFESPLKSSLIGKAAESGIIEFNIVDIRHYSEDKHRRCDDYPYGGGCGMVMTPGPVFGAMEALSGPSRVILASASGKPLNQALVRELCTEEAITVICGHYEGIDQRVIEKYVDDEISIGDYVLSGGEYAALVIADSMSRFVPGFMSNTASLEDESYENGLLEYPQYTRPEEINGLKVPEVLLSGHHEKIEKWRNTKRLDKTRDVRPDLYKNFILKQITGD